jgi:hypothetical protein
MSSFKAFCSHCFAVLVLTAMARNLEIKVSISSIQRVSHTTSEMSPKTVAQDGYSLPLPVACAARSGADH